jgi:hypothetical protein
LYVGFATLLSASGEGVKRSHHLASRRQAGSFFSAER